MVVVTRWGYWLSTIGMALIGVVLGLTVIAADFQRLHCWGRPDAYRELLDGACVFGNIGLVMAVVFYSFLESDKVRWDLWLWALALGAFGAWAVGKPFYVSSLGFATGVVLGGWIAVENEPDFPLLLFLLVPGVLTLVMGPMLGLILAWDPEARLRDLAMDAWLRVTLMGLGMTVLTMLLKRARFVLL